MMCADHPGRYAVAIITSKEYSSQFGACDQCYKDHKKNVRFVQEAFAKKKLEAKK